MKIERFFYAGKFTIGFGISSELWHIERKNGSKAINFFTSAIRLTLTRNKSLKRH